MTTYAPNYTGRYRVHYVSAGIQHVAQLRRSRGASPSSVGLLAATMRAAFAPWVADLPTDFAWISAEQADEDSDLFYPSTLPATLTGLRGTNLYTPMNKITHTRFAARALGSRSALEIYGIWWEFTNKTDDVNDYAYNGVVDPTEDSRVADTAAALNTQAFANSGGPTTWYSRATVKINDYWLRQLRKGVIS